MTRDARPPGRPPVRPPIPASMPPSFDDESVGWLVRDVVGGWAMPPVRLDAPSWRDRVRGRRARALDGARHGLGRAGQAGMAALALTVGAALIAVIVTRPSQQPAGSPNPTGGGPSAPSTAVATPLPRLHVNGDAPFPSRILVANEAGDIALIDLGLGTISGSIARAQWPSAMSVTGTGLVVCICITTADAVGGFPTTLDVRVKSFTRATTPIRDDPVRVLTGTPDPRDPATRLEHVLTSTAFSPDDRSAYVGWSARDGRVWHSGVLVVDIAAGAVVREQRFPDMTAGDGDAHRRVAAPRVLGTDGAGRLALAREWAEWGSSNVDVVPARARDEAFTSSIAAAGEPELMRLPDAASCGGTYLRAGAVPGGGTWLTCLAAGGSLDLLRVAGDGTGLGTETITRTGSIDGDTTTVSPDGATFYAWDPGSFSLARIDLTTGERTDRRLVRTAASIDPLAAVGRWLAPAADAKSILRGAILVSPDGARLYVLTTLPVADERQPAGSAGILVVDAATLDVIDHWSPTADFVSIALNADGSLLYSAGMPGVDATGAAMASQEASVTVFDTETGDVRLVAGELGGSMLNFPGPIVP